MTCLILWLFFGRKTKIVAGHDDRELGAIGWAELKPHPFIYQDGPEDVRGPQYKNCLLIPVTLVSVDVYPFEGVHRSIPVMREVIDWITPSLRLRAYTVEECLDLMMEYEGVNISPTTRSLVWYNTAYLMHWFTVCRAERYDLDCIRADLHYDARRIARKRYRIQMARTYMALRMKKVSFKNKFKIFFRSLFFSFSYVMLPSSLFIHLFFHFVLQIHLSIAICVNLALTPIIGVITYASGATRMDRMDGKNYLKFPERLKAPRL